MHGGATPEEVIVPAAHYKLVQADWKVPAFRLVAPSLERAPRLSLFVQRRTCLEIEIQNRNPIQLNIVSATVVSPAGDLKGVDLPIVPGLGTGILRLECSFSKTAADAKEISVEVAYEIAGQRQTKTMVIECEFKTAMSTGISLKDL
jgi:hypothetical protein